MSREGMLGGCWRLLPALLVGSVLAGCAEEPLAPLDSRFAHSLAAVRLDPPALAASLNAYRTSHGLGSVRLDSALTAMAQRQADAMVAGDALSHTVGGTFQARLAASRIDTPEAGENLGAGYFSLEEAMAGWRGSPDHDANLLIAHATRIGVSRSPRACTRTTASIGRLSSPPIPERPSTALRVGGF